MTPEERNILEAFHRSISDLEKGVVELKTMLRQVLEATRENTRLLDGLCVVLAVEPEEVRKHAQAANGR